MDGDLKQSWDVSLNSLFHWANGVNEDELLRVLSLVKGNTTEQDNRPWNNFEILKLVECKLVDKGQLRILHHAGREKVHEYYQGAVKNS